MDVRSRKGTERGMVGKREKRKRIVQIHDIVFVSLQDAMSDCLEEIHRMSGDD